MGVVNCFHFSVSLGYKTTYYFPCSITVLLWIAFIFQYLWDTKQLFLVIYPNVKGCELLSFFSIFGIQNNFWSYTVALQRVVNCFHFSVSLGYKTTLSHQLPLCTLLWIAFIFQYLWDTKQLQQDSDNPFYRCELLSFFSIFGIQNN